MLNTALLTALTAAVGSALVVPRLDTCDDVQKGYQCQPEISHIWGQYSPWFSVASDISPDVPPQCTVTFAQLLSRHGARDPTASKTKAYNVTIAKIKQNVKSYQGDYSFLADYQYTLGADQLTDFGEQEMVNSGIKFFNRYPLLSAILPPFVRASDQTRVVESALNWTQGFHQAKTSKGVPDLYYPYPVLQISEAEGQNNTLNHDICTAFETGPYSKIASSAQAQWAAVFVPPIQKRLNANLPGAGLTSSDTINIMDLCPYNTVASTQGTVSQFCKLFSQQEWQQYNYYQSLNKFYGYGAGNPLGPTQGVGFTNELIARLTNRPVNDTTSTNRTLDSNSATFPLGRQLYADFSHDNDMTAIFFAMGLYSNVPQLSNTTMTPPQQLNGYSAANTVPFAARAYFEKLICLDRPGQEQVRVLINDRVIPLTGCGSDSLGRCSVNKFVDSLGFARSGGRWNECFA